MNVTKKIAGTLGILFLLSSCSLIDSVLGNLPDNDMGTLLSVDSDGHFKEVVEYDFGNLKRVYKEDGSFTEYSYGYSATQGKSVLSGTLDGTYSWDPDTFIIEYYFDTYTDEETDTVYEQDYNGKLTIYFTDTNSGSAYLPTSDDGESWKYSRVYTYPDGSEEIYTYTFTITNTSISYSYTDEERDPNGTFFSGTKNEVEFDIIGIYPEGTEWKSGNSVTFTVEETIDREATSTTGEYNVWTDYSLERTTLSFGNAGDFMFFNSSSSAKSLDSVE